jgi:phage tail sheath gpL-like
MGVDATAVARVTGVTTSFKNLRGGNVVFLPQHIAVIAQGATSVDFDTEKFQALSHRQVGETLGWGSPAHLIVRELLPDNGDGVGSIPVIVYPITDAYDVGVAATGTITPSGTASAAGTYQVRIGGILSAPFSIAAGAITVATVTAAMVAAINATIHMPMIATDGTTVVNLAAKWQGVLSGADCTVEIVGDDLGVVFTIVQPTGGSGEPDIDGALAQIGNVWETLIVNGIGTSASLDTIQEFGETRWGTLVKKPLIAVGGSAATDATLLIAVGNARKDDRINSVVNVPGTVSLSFVIAARAAARMAVLAQNNPPTDYANQRLNTILPGADGDQWDFATRDLLVKAGIGTTELRDGVVVMSDTVTFYHPDGEEPPAYRYAVDIVKVSQVIFNADLIFSSDDWAGMPLIPDNQPTTNANARKPKMAKAELSALFDSLGLEAILSDPQYAKDNTTATINTTNPKRLDVVTTFKIAGNTNIISVGLNWGFYFGTATVIG